MNKHTIYLIALLMATVTSYSQPNNYIKRPALGINFFFNDFKTAAAIRATSLKTTLSDHNVARFKDMTPGLAISYLKGISNHFDFVTTLSASIFDYPLDNDVLLGNQKLLLEWDAMVHAKLFSDKHVVSPYLSLGIGASKYDVYYGAFLPAGIGVQINIANEAFVLLNSQYRMKISDNTNYHFYHSIGIAGNIGKEKEVKVIPPPPVPVVVIETPKPVDTDSDGIVDTTDKCPTVAGVARYQGCPVPDTDGDGVNDEEDKCPAVAGVARHQGCPIPDTDGDGVNDEEDKCITVPGVAANYGCPVISEVIIKRVAYAANNILFATGSAKLLAKSNAGLDEIIALLIETPDLKLDIDGHTDDVGTSESNQVLSQQRANAVRDYFVKKGIAASRLMSLGHGEDEPIADNKTAAGRSKNRRVELELKYY